MKLPISGRLLACCNFINPGDRVADIGCDHGYLGIYLLKNGIAKHVIAADINPMPLRSAMANAEKYGTKDDMEFYLSDGARAIPRDFNTLVCAGVGGDTMISILEASPWLSDSRYRLVLQCQSRNAMLRKYLSEQGWYIRREQVLQDGRFLYTVMEVIFEPGHPLTPGQFYLSPAALETPDPTVRKYYQQVLFKLERAITGQADHADPEMVQALRELKALSALSVYAWLKEDIHGNGK